MNRFSYLLVFLGFLLVSCGGETDESNAAADEASPPEKAEEADPAETARAPKEGTPLSKVEITEEVLALLAKAAEAHPLGSPSEKSTRER